MHRYPTSTIHRHLDLPSTQRIQTTHITTYAFFQVPQSTFHPLCSHHHNQNTETYPPNTHRVDHTPPTPPDSTPGQTNTHLTHPTITSHSMQHTRTMHVISSEHTTLTACTTYTYPSHQQTIPFPRPNHSRIHLTLQTRNPH